MARNHGRLGLENKLLENKIWPNFFAFDKSCKPAFYTFYTSHLR